MNSQLISKFNTELFYQPEVDAESLEEGLKILLKIDIFTLTWKYDIGLTRKK